MEIRRYANRRFAGMRDQEVCFRPGMNVVLGDNETGKSTMVSGIYGTLFTHSKLNRKTKADEEFIQSSFPADGGNSIDGTVEMVQAGVKITVEKEWGKTSADDSRTVLTYDGGKQVKRDAAEKELKELLPYGAGIYNYVVFGRQSNEAAILDWYYSFAEDKPGKNAGEDVLRAREKVSEAFSAASGIAPEEYERKLEEKLQALGSNWDFSLDAPKGGRGIKNPHRQKVGEVLQAYYALENRRREREDGKRGLEEVNALKQELGRRQEEKQRLEMKMQELQTLEGSAALQTSRQSREKEMEQLERDFRSWPRLQEEHRLLSALKREDEERQNRARKAGIQENIRKIRDLTAQRDRLLETAGPLQGIEKDLKKCGDLLAQAEGARLALSSGRLHTRIAMQGGYTARLSMAGGGTVEVGASWEQDVDGFAKIEIPGVGVITVAPQDVDVEALEGRIETCTADAGKILEKYGVDGLGQLKGKEQAYREAMQAVSRLDGELARIPDSGRLAKLEEERDAIPVCGDIQVREDLDGAIRLALGTCQERTLAERLAVVESFLRDLEGKYTSMAELGRLVEVQKGKVEEIRARLAALPPLTFPPEEFDRQKREAQTALTGRDGKGGVVQEIYELTRKLGAKEKEADEVDLDGIEADIREKEQEWERRKKLYRQYSRIQADFLRLKEEQGEQFTAFYRQFNEYLSRITHGQVQQEAGAALKSKGNALASKELLSQGTKQAVLLAFRLALLKFYYPDEGGVAVLDDTLLDMDPARREGAAQLLREFAKSNQVIFTTCDPGIARMLGGNLVVFG